MTWNEQEFLRHYDEASRYETLQPVALPTSLPIRDRMRYPEPIWREGWTLKPPWTPLRQE